MYVGILLCITKIEFETLSNLYMRSSIIIILFIGAHYVRKGSTLFLLWRQAAFLLSTAVPFFFVDVETLKIVRQWTTDWRSNIIIKLQRIRPYLKSWWRLIIVNFLIVVIDVLATAFLNWAYR